MPIHRPADPDLERGNDGLRQTTMPLPLSPHRGGVAPPLRAMICSENAMAGLVLPTRFSTVFLPVSFSAEGIQPLNVGLAPLHRPLRSPMSISRSQARSRYDSTLGQPPPCPRRPHPRVPGGRVPSQAPARRPSVRPPCPVPGVHRSACVPGLRWAAHETVSPRSGSLGVVLDDR